MPAAALGEMVVGECAGLFVCRGTDQVLGGPSHNDDRVTASDYIPIQFLSDRE